RRGGRTSESRAGDSLDGFNAARCATAALSYVIAGLDPAIHAGSSAVATAVFRLALFDLQRQLWTIYAVAASRVGWATNGLLMLSHYPLLGCGIGSQRAMRT